MTGGWVGMNNNDNENRDKGYPRMVQQLAKGAQAKSAAMKATCINLLANALEKWDTSSFERATGFVERLLRDRLVDADAAVRAEARTCFWRFQARYAVEASNVRDSLDAGAQRHLDMARTKQEEVVNTEDEIGRSAFLSRDARTAALGKPTRHQASAMMLPNHSQNPIQQQSPDAPSQHPPPPPLATATEAATATMSTSLGRKGAQRIIAPENKSGVANYHRTGSSSGEPATRSRARRISIVEGPLRVSCLRNTPGLASPNQATLSSISSEAHQSTSVARSPKDSRFTVSSCVSAFLESVVGKNAGSAVVHWQTRVECACSMRQILSGYACLDAKDAHGVRLAIPELINDGHHKVTQAVLESVVGWLQEDPSDGGPPAAIVFNMLLPTVSLKLHDVKVRVFACVCVATTRYLIYVVARCLVLISTATNARVGGGGV